MHLRCLALSLMLRLAFVLLSESLDVDVDVILIKVSLLREFLLEMLDMHFVNLTSTFAFILKLGPPACCLWLIEFV